jgi:plasmid stabilization system protein ParE
MMPVRVLPEAFEDLAQAVDWYHRRRDGLGDEFAELFFLSVQAIARNPRLRPQAYRDFRRHLLKRFPYCVYYRIHQQEIIVALIYHQARNPKILQRLLREREKLI